VNNEPRNAEDAPKSSPEPGARAESEKKKTTAKEAKPAPSPSLGPAPLFAARPAFALAAASGLGYFFGFPGMNLWPLAFVSQALLLLALRGQTPKRAALLGLTAGFAMNVTGFAWLLEMLKVFSGFPTPVCILFVGILCAYQGGRIALAGWLYARAERRGFHPALVFVLAFIASELAYPLLFPWYFGASVHNAAVFMQVADVGGPYLVAVVLLGSNIAIAEVVASRLEKRAMDRRVIIAGALLPVLGAIYGLIRISNVEARMAAAEPVKIGIVQGNQPLFSRRGAIPVHLRLTEKVRQEGAQLVVWSEGAAPGAFPESEDLDLVRTRLASKLQVPAILGIGIHRPAKPRSIHFNSAVLTDETGKVLGRYDKQYLLAFGEYLPFGETFPDLYKYSPNSGRFLPGTSLEPLVWGEHRITTLICYEDILPAFVNKLVRHGNPDLLVNLTNDAWFGDTAEPWEHLALAQLRAVEHRRFLIRSTNSGVSAVIDAVGRVVRHTETFQEAGIVEQARFMRSTTVYEVIGDVPVYLATAAVVVMGFVRRRRRAAKAA
jgi:apolipoprotein N-acyltransferase